MNLNNSKSISKVESAIEQRSVVFLAYINLEFKSENIMDLRRAFNTLSAAESVTKLQETKLTDIAFIAILYHAGQTLGKRKPRKHLFFYAQIPMHAKKFQRLVDLVFSLTHMLSDSSF